MFWKILRNAQQNTCVGVFYITLQACRPPALLKRDSNAGAFLWILRNFKEHLFWSTSPNGCFWKLKILNKRINKFRNYLPRWGTDFHDSKYFFQVNLIFIVDSSRTGFYSGLLWKYELRWLVGLKLIELEQQKTQFPFIILTKNLKSILCRVIKVHKNLWTGNKQFARSNSNGKNNIISLKNSTFCELQVLIELTFPNNFQFSIFILQESSKLCLIFSYFSTVSEKWVNLSHQKLLFNRILKEC